jgi:hypothetical protein
VDKKCLIIDDDADIQSRFEVVKQKGHEEGLLVDCLFFNPLDECTNSDLAIDPQKVKDKLWALIDANKVDLVACDYNLGDENVTGLEVIHIVREKDRNCIIILYSGVLYGIIEKILSDREEGSSKPTIKKLKKLITDRVSDFTDREDFTNDIVHHLLNNVPLEMEIIDQLLKYKDMMFQHGYTQFEDKRFDEIAREIRSGSIHGKRFSKEILERGIAHMIDLNTSS